MTAIEEFVLDKMGAYIIGGMAPVTAARFTRGELEAVFRRNHWSRNNSGAMCQTPLPEALGIEKAMVKCDEALAEILKICEERAEKGPTLNAKPEKADSSTRAPETPPKAQEITSGAPKGNGLDGLKNYVKRKTA